MDVDALIPAPLNGPNVTGGSSFLTKKIYIIIIILISVLLLCGILYLYRKFSEPVLKEDAMPPMGRPAMHPYDGHRSMQSPFMLPEYNVPSFVAEFGPPPQMSMKPVTIPPKVVISELMPELKISDFPAINEKSPPAAPAAPVAEKMSSAVAEIKEKEEPAPEIKIVDDDDDPIVIMEIEDDDVSIAE